MNRILVPAQMSGRELARRRFALALLTALPLAFYAARAHHSSHAAITGGIAMAFSVAGASIFTALTAREIDQRLMLAGYRPHQLLLGRLLTLELLGAVIGALFSAVIVLGTSPARPWALVGGVEEVALISVPFGLAVGALAPHELEAVLILIGIVGIQLTLDPTQAIAKILPFWGPQRLIAHAIDPSLPPGMAIPAAAAYAAGLLAAAVSVTHARAPKMSRYVP